MSALLSVVLGSEVIVVALQRLILFGIAGIADGRLLKVVARRESHASAELKQNACMETYLCACIS